MARSWLRRALVLGGGLVAGCASAPQSEVPAAGAPAPAARGELVVAVLPLTGHAAVRRSAGEWLAHKLHAGSRLNVLYPGFAEAKLPHGLGLEDVHEIGRLLGAQLVISGSIEFAERGQTPRIDLRVVHALRKEVLAQVTEPAGLALFSHDPYELARIAVEQAATRTLTALQEELAIVSRPAQASGFRYKDGSRAWPCAAGLRRDASGTCR